jgi:DNA-binding MarR family transcriptional regulator
MNCSVTENEIRIFIREFADDYDSREVLRLLGRHPYTRFNLSALADSLDMKPKDVGRTINRLEEKGLVRTIECKATALYALTENESKRDLITKTAALDYRQMATLDAHRV